MILCSSAPHRSGCADGGRPRDGRHAVPARRGAGWEGFGFSPKLDENNDRIRCKMRGILKFAPVGRKLPINAAKRPGNLGVSSNSRASQSKLPSAVRMQYSTPRCLCQPTNFRCRSPLPPLGEGMGRTRRAVPSPPVRRASRRPRDAWAHPARSRSQPARGRRPERGLCGDGGTRRRIAARYGGAVALACGRLTVSPYCSSFGFAQTCFPLNDANLFRFLFLLYKT